MWLKARKQFIIHKATQTLLNSVGAGKISLDSSGYDVAAILQIWSNLVLVKMRHVRNIRDLLGSVQGTEDFSGRSLIQVLFRVCCELGL